MVWLEASCWLLPRNRAWKIGPESHQLEALVNLTPSRRQSAPRAGGHAARRGPPRALARHAVKVSTGRPLGRLRLCTGFPCRTASRTRTARPWDHWYPREPGSRVVLGRAAGCGFHVSKSRVKITCHSSRGPRSGCGWVAGRCAASVMLRVGAGSASPARPRKMRLDAPLRVPLGYFQSWRSNARMGFCSGHCAIIDSIPFNCRSNIIEF
jgi:hypothetical protein